MSPPHLPTPILSLGISIEEGGTIETLLPPQGARRGDTAITFPWPSLQSWRGRHARPVAASVTRAHLVQKVDLRPRLQKKTKNCWWQSSARFG